MIKVLIADDHHLFREGLARIIRDTPGLDLVGSAINGEGAIELAEKYLPDVILMDVNLPGMGGLEASKRICAAFPETQILILTVSEKKEDLFTAFRFGARGYLLKNLSTQGLIEGIRQVHAGESPINPRMASKLIDEFVVLSLAAPVSSENNIKTELITDREKDVLKLVARGLSNKEIGAALSISPLTVKAHFSSILDKLQLRGRVEATAWAIRHGVLRDDQI
jgi:DNA-binding NarL/FixJ family response regulator